MFSTDLFLSILAEQDELFSDGSFKKTPTPFYQVMTFHGYKGLEKIPLAIFLLTNKKKDTYKYVIKTLQDEVHRVTGNNLSPKKFTSDFERGLISAILEEFPQCDIHGCSYHHACCIYRKLEKFKLKTLYDKNEEFQSKFKKFQALAFLPVEHVKNAFVDLLNMNYFFTFKSFTLTDYMRKNITEVSIRY